MIRRVLENVSGSGALAAAALVLFFGVFALMLAWVARLRKPHLEHMRRLPLEDASAPPDQGATR